MVRSAAARFAPVTVLSERGAPPEIVRQRIHGSASCRRTVRLQRCLVIRGRTRVQQIMLLEGVHGKRKAAARTVAERRRDLGVPTAPRTDRHGRHKPIARTVRRGRALRSLAHGRLLGIARTRRRSVAHRRITMAAILRSREATRRRGLTRLQAGATRRRRGRIQLQAAVTLRRRRGRIRLLAAVTLRRHRVLPQRRAVALVAEATLAAVEAEVRMAEAPALTAGRNFQANRTPAPESTERAFFLICANSSVRTAIVNPTPGVCHRTQLLRCAGVR